MEIMDYDTLILGNNKIKNKPNQKRRWCVKNLSYISVFYSLDSHYMQKKSHIYLLYLSK